MSSLATFINPMFKADHIAATLRRAYAVHASDEDIQSIKAGDNSVMQRINDLYDTNTSKQAGGGGKRLRKNFLGESRENQENRDVLVHRADVEARKM